MIVKTTLAAIEKAATDYVLFSGGASSWSAPEYFYTTCIARRIAKIRNAPFVTLESRIADTMKAAGCKSDGNWGKQRFDIVLWRDEVPIAAIEVKHVHDFNQKDRADVVRLCSVLKEDEKNNSFRYGILAHLVSGQTLVNGQIAFGLLAGRIRDSKQQVRQLVEKHGESLRVTNHVRRILPSDNGREFAAMVHRISRLHLA